MGSSFHHGDHRNWSPAFCFAYWEYAEFSPGSWAQVENGSLVHTRDTELGFISSINLTFSVVKYFISFFLQEARNVSQTP